MNKNIFFLLLLPLQILGAAGNDDTSDSDVSEYEIEKKPARKTNKKRKISASEKKHYCTELGCGKAFARGSILKEHMRTHTGEKPYPCTHAGCNYAAIRGGDLTKHMRTHTGKKPYKCKEPECDEAFTQSGHLKAHMLTHTGEKPFKCQEPECDYTTAQQGNLARHMLTHTGGKPYQCEHPGCGKAFIQSGHFKTHMLTHTGEKPCGKAFAIQGTLKAHVRTHTGEKPFTCDHPECGKAFAQGSDLKRHMLTHEKEKALSQLPRRKRVAEIPVEQYEALRSSSSSGALPHEFSAAEPLGHAAQPAMPIPLGHHDALLSSSSSASPAGWALAEQIQEPEPSVPPFEWPYEQQFSPGLTEPDLLSCAAAQAAYQGSEGEGEDELHDPVFYTESNDD